MIRIVKTFARIALLTLVVALFAACTSDPKKIEMQEKALDAQARFYDEEAEGWREDGNKGMAKYFEGKAQETRERRANLNYNLFDF